ncbi:MAG: (Fe-S)-binding protein [Clostridiales bacterium]|nr:(Fe-S)-binding protein [Clostridiales bacterium]
MIMSEKCKQHVDSCRFCWMCHHICPIGNATGQERNTARARALGISLVNRGAIDLSEIMDNIYECCTCGACVHDCITGWDPVMFTKETRLQAALEGKLPEYIMTLVSNCIETGNAYGKTATCDTLTAAIKAHADKKDTLLLLGVDAKFMACQQALKAIKVLEKAGVDFAVLENEVPTGVQLDFLIGAANETKEQMAACAKVLDQYKTVVVYDPNDSKAIKQLYKEYGIEVKANVVTYTSFVADLIKDGKLKAVNSGKKVVFQDPYQLSRDLEETEPAREIVSAYASLDEMLLNRAETVWAGNILMAQYMPEIIKKVAARRIFNATSIGANAIVTACVSEYVSLKAVAEDVEIISIEDLILGE